MHLQIGCEVKPVLMEADVVVLTGSGETLGERCETVASSLASAAALKLLITREKDLASQVDASVTERLTGIACAVLSGPMDVDDLAAGDSSELSLSGSDEDGFLADVVEMMKAR